MDNKNIIHSTEDRKKQQRFNSYKNTIRKIESIIEVAIFTILYYVMWTYAYRGEMFPYYGRGRYIVLGIYVVLMYIILKLNRSFEFGHLKASEVLASLIISVLIVNLITYFQLSLMANHMLRVLPMFVLYAAEILLGAVCAYVYTAIYHMNNVPHDMLMIYGNENVVTLKFKMDTRSDKYKVTRVMSIDEGLDAIKEAVFQHDSVILNDVPAEIRNDILKGCYKHGIRTYMVPKISDIIIRGADDITLFDTPLILVRARGLTPMQKFAKRALDIFVCCIAMIFFIPIYMIVAIAIKIEDRGSGFL